MRSIKCVVVGDDGVGKTSLLITYSTHSFPANAPNTYGNYASNIILDDKPINLSIWDTAGADEFDQLRAMAYAETDIIIICFSLVDPNTLQKVREKWNPEVGRYCPDVPIILVGTKLDLRRDEERAAAISAGGGITATGARTSISGPAGGTADGEKHRQARRMTSIDHLHGIAMAKEIDAVKFVECSSLTQKNVSVVFDEAIRAVLYPVCSKHNERNCQKCEKEPKSGCIIQ